MRICFLVREDKDEHPGLMMLSSVLKQNGYLPFLIKATEANAREVLDSGGGETTLFAYSITSFSAHFFLDLNAKLKKSYKFFSVFGGYFATGYPDVIEYEGVDAVCVGESEYALLELVKALDLGTSYENIKNVWCKTSGGIKRNDPRRLVKNLDELPFADRGLIKERSDFYKDRIFMLASRGCVYACDHCYNSTLRNMYPQQDHYRRRSVENVLAELRAIKKTLDYKYVLFFDDVFISSYEWLKEFSCKYAKEFSIPFRCNVRINLINEKVLKLLSEANCHTVSFGLEVGKEETVKRLLTRDISIAEVRNKCGMIKSMGILLRTSNMIGLPNSSIEDDLETMRLNIDCKVDYALCSFFLPYPGTDYTRKNVGKVEANSLLRCDKADKDDVSLTKVTSRLIGSSDEPYYDSANAEKKMQRCNLFDLFTLAINVPVVMFFLPVMIRFPFRNLYTRINLFWSWYMNTFVLYPTQGVQGYVGSTLLRMCKIGCEGRSSDPATKGKDHHVSQADVYGVGSYFSLPLKADPMIDKMRGEVERAITSGSFTFEKKSCLCEGHVDVPISDSDCMGFPVKYVLCRACGLIRMDPLFSGRTAEQFHRDYYRRLYRHPSVSDKQYFRRSIKRGQAVLSFMRKNVRGLDLRGKSVFEFGCGTGGTLVPFMKAGALVKGYDCDAGAIALGKTFAQQLDLSCADEKVITQEDYKYDFVICRHVLEHCVEPQKILEFLKSKLKPGGLLYVEVPGVRNPRFYYGPKMDLVGMLQIAHPFVFSDKTLRNLMKGWDEVVLDEWVRGVFINRANQNVRDCLENDFNRSIAYLKDYQRGFGWKMRRGAIKITACVSFYLSKWGLDVF